METKQEFIIKTLKPYLLDNSICAYDNVGCFYLTSDGRKCAFGQWMKKGRWQNEVLCVDSINNEYGLKKVLKKEALVQNLSIEEWSKIQDVHDGLAMNESSISIISYIEDLEELSKIDLTELKELL